MHAIVRLSVNQPSFAHSKYMTGVQKTETRVTQTGCVRGHVTSLNFGK